MRIIELLESIDSIPYEKNPDIGWWEDQDTVTVYHGTHDRNVSDILQNGLTKADPVTGMISVTSDPNTAHGYAAMSGAGGEANFRKAGAKPVHVPHEERSVIKFALPINWLKQHMDKNFSGNIGDARKHLTSKDEYVKWKEQSKTDSEYYQTSEFRLDTPIPPEYIVGVMKRNK